MSKTHKCLQCGNEYDCNSPNVCQFNKETPDCVKCWKLFDQSTMFVDRFPNSKYQGPKQVISSEANSVESERVEIKRDSQEAEGEL